MPRIKKIVRNNFTTVHNDFLWDTSLSITDRGLLITMLSRPDDWDFSGKGLAKILPDGEKKVYAALKRLEELGYLKRIRVHDEQGRVTDWEYQFSDSPVFLSDDYDEEPVAENGEVVENTPVAENGEVVEEEPVCPFPVAENGEVDTYLNNKINNNLVYNNSNQSNLVTSTEDLIDLIDEEKTKEELEFVKRNLQIPYSLPRKKNIFTDAIKILAEYEVLVSSARTPYQMSSFNLIIQQLAQMCLIDVAAYNKANITHTRVIDVINEKMGESGGLYDFIVYAERKWSVICNEREVHSALRYLRACLWSWLQLTPEEREIEDIF